MSGTEFFNQIADAVVGLWNDPLIWVMVAHIIVNTLLSVFSAIRNGWFTLNKTWEFLYKKIIPAVGVYVTFAIFGAFLGFGSFNGIIFVVIESWILTDTLQTLKELGLPVPDALTKARTDIADMVSRGNLPPDA